MLLTAAMLRAERLQLTASWLQVADFGLSRQHGNDATQATSNVGINPRWLAPEVCWSWQVLCALRILIPQLSQRYVRR